MATIYSKGKTDVAMSGIPIAYLNDNIDEIATSKFHGRLIELMDLTAPKIYPKYVTM